MTAYLDADTIIDLHEDEVGAGVADRAGIESAAARPLSGFGGQEAFPTLWLKGAALLHGLSSTQYFVDGNKRTAWLATVVFLRANGYRIRDVPEIAAEAFVLAVCTGLIDLQKTAEWLAVHAEGTDTTGGLMQLTGGRVRLVDLADAAGHVHDVKATDVTILGPAVLVPLDGTSFDGCSWDAGDGGSEAVVWEIEPNRPAIVGAVGVHASSFVRCQFVNVGFAGPHELLMRFLGASSV